jgi:hypothetical protein
MKQRPYLLPVEIINKEIAPVVTPEHNMMEGPWCIQAGTTWHETTLPTRQGCQEKVMNETTSLPTYRGVKRK